MFARLVILLAMLALTVVTTAASAHAARMGMEPGAHHAAHVVQMTHAPDMTHMACDPDHLPGAGNGEGCDFVCAGLLAFLAVPGGDAVQDHGPADHDVASEAIHTGHAPGLGERPPRSRLL